MSAYLARLKQLENEKNSHYAPNTEPPKPPKVPFDPFGGKHPAHIDKKIIAEAELRKLVADVYAADTPADQAEALAAALADPDDALLCYRAIVAETCAAIAKAKG